MKRIRNQEGLTLIELAIVIGVIAILAMVVTFSGRSRDTAKIGRLTTDIKTIRNIVENYVKANASVNYQYVTPASLVAWDPAAGLFWNSNGTVKNVNPWQGYYNVESPPPYNTYYVQACNIPSDLGGPLISIYQNSSSSVSFSGGCLRVDFY